MNVSIIVCTYNRAEDLAKVLAQLVDQIAKTSFQIEVLVVDNNSTDNTKDVVQNYAKQCGTIRYVLEARQGKPYALNMAIGCAQNDWLIFTDDDVVLGDAWLASVQKVVAANKTKCFFGKIKSFWQIKEPNWFDERMRSVIVNADHGEKLKAPMNYLVGANMGIHRDVFKQCGNFNEHLKRFEDAELSLRVRKHYDIVYVPDMIVSHPVMMDRLTKKYFRRWYYEMGCFEKFVIDLNDKPFLKMPRWIYRKCLGHVWGAVISRQENERFYHELHLYRFGGLFQTIWGRNIS